jgi:hypothetical protein
MIENTVQHDADIPPMGFLHKMSKLLIRAKAGVDPIIIGSGILMVEIPQENRGQVDAIHMKGFQIVKLSNYPIKVAAKIVFPGGSAFPGFIPVKGFARIPNGEPFGKDFIIYDALAPIGDLCHIVVVGVQKFKESAFRR